MRPRLDVQPRSPRRRAQAPVHPAGRELSVGDDPRGIAGRAHILRLAAPPAGALDDDVLVLAADAAAAEAAIAAGADPTPCT